MTTLTKVLVPVALIIAVAVGGLYLIKSRVGDAPSGRADVTIGAVLPDFTLDRWGGGTLRASEVQAKVVMVNFWATWCEACMVEMPSIVAVREAYKDKGFEVLAVNLDENPEAVLPRALQEFGIKFPVFTDKEGRAGELFGVQAIPLTVIIDKNRRILFIESGERDWNGQEFRSRLEAWLSG